MELILNLTTVVNFCEVVKAQLAKSTLLTSTLVPLEYFKVYSDAKHRVGCRKQREAIAPIESLVRLQPFFFLSLRWKNCLRQNCSVGSCACSEWPALGQNTLIIYMYVLHGRLARWIKWRAWDVGEAKEWLENELWLSSAHSPTFPTLHLRHNLFFNPSVALPTSQLTLQPFRYFSYVTAHSPTLLSLLLRHKHSIAFHYDH